MQYNGIEVDLSRDELLSEEAKRLLAEYYMLPSEASPQFAFARAALAYSDSTEMAQRIYDYASQLWFMFSSPILSNAPERGATDQRHGLPISCYLCYAPDSIPGQLSLMDEVARLSVAGGGVGVHNGIRAVSSKAPGPIPYMKVLDSEIGYFRQGKTRRGSLAYYMDIDHPDIVEHINFRKRAGGDAARKAGNKKSFHVAVNIPDSFMEAVLENKTIDLRCPHSGESRESVSARSLWEMVLESRTETGEPYIHWIDRSNEKLPDRLKAQGLRVRGSNLCSEITLPTDENYTAVCCLSSVNLEYYDEWKDTTMVKDLIRFLDNVISAFCEQASLPGLVSAFVSAGNERSLGLGAMGFHSYLQRKGIPFESGGLNSAAQLNNQMFKRIKEDAVQATQALAKEKGEPLGTRGTGTRNAHLLAIAPNSNSSTICGTSPSIEPWSGNAFVASTRAGAYVVKNKYLRSALALRDMDTDDVWASILKNDGSIQHLTSLDETVRNTFKTAWEIDQHWVVQHAADRQGLICQAQSLNVFFKAGSSRDYINSVHLKAYTGGLKTMYYLRTTNKQKVDTVKEKERVRLEDWAGEECVACQG